VVKAQNEDVILRASVLDSDGSTTLDAENGTVALLTAKDTDFQSIKTDSSNALWFKTRDAGHVHETVQMVKITADGGLVINAGNGVVVEYRDTGSLEDSVEVLSQQPGLEWMAQVRDRDDAVWQAVQEAHKEWDYKAEGLSGAASAVIAIAIAIATYGAGAALVGAAQGTIQAAVANAALTTLATQASLSLINNKGNLGAAFKDLASKETLKALATSMVVAGLTTGLVDAINAGLPDGQAIASSAKTATLTQKIAYQSIQASVKTLADATINGQDLGDALKANLMSAAVNVASSVAFKAIGDFAGSKGVEIPDGDIRKVIMHAAAGCAIGQLTSKNCMAGAIGAGLQELAGDVFKDLAGDKKVELRVKLAGLAGALATALAGGDASAVNTASTIAEAAATYNRQLHTVEIKKLKEEAAKLAGVDGRSEEEWLQVLSQEALRRIDAEGAENLADVPVDQEAVAILDQMIAAHGASFVDELGRQVGFLTQERGHFENAALYADKIQENRDFYNTAFRDYVPKDLPQLAGVVDPATLMTADAMRYASFGDILANTDRTAAASPEEQIKQLFALEKNSANIHQVNADLRAREAELRTQLADAAPEDRVVIQSQINGLKNLRLGLESTSGSFAHYQWQVAQQGFNEGTGIFLKEGAEGTIKAVRSIAAYAKDSALASLGDSDALARNNERVEVMLQVLANLDELPEAYADNFVQNLQKAGEAYRNGDLRGGSRILGAAQAEIYSLASAAVTGGASAGATVTKGLAKVALKLKPEIDLPPGYVWEAREGVQVAVASDGQVYKLTDKTTSDGRPIFETESGGSTAHTVLNDIPSGNGGINQPEMNFSQAEFERLYGSKFDSSAEASEAFKQYDLAANTQSELVLGRLVDTEAGSELGMTRLNSDGWTVNVNDAFVQGGIDAGKPFYLGSSPDIANYRAAWDAVTSSRGTHPETVFFREMKQLRDAGYRLEGNYMLPPN